MGFSMQMIENFETRTCCMCGTLFATTAYFIAERRKDKGRFFCPNGHGQSFTEHEADRLRRERDRLAQLIAQKNDEILAERRMRADAEAAERKAVRKTKRLEKRAAAGLCPCCNRTFLALQAHMKSKHPDFRAEDAVRENVVALIKSRAVG